MCSATTTAISGPGTTWDTIAEQHQAGRVVRRHAARRICRSTPAAPASMRRSPSICGAGRPRHRIRLHQPDAHRPGRRAQGRMAAGDSRHRHRDHAGAGAHAGRRRAARPGVPRPLHRRLRANSAATSWARTTASRRTRPGRRASPASMPRPSASSRARMAATRTFITTTWSLQRADHGEQPIWMTVVLAAMLGQIGLPGGGFGFGYGSMNRMGQARSPVAALNRPIGRSPINSYIPVARISDLLLQSGRDHRLQRPAHHFPRHQADLLVRRQSVPPSPGHQPAGAGLAAARDRHRARDLLDADGALRRHRAAGDHDARAQRHRARRPTATCSRCIRRSSRSARRATTSTSSPTSPDGSASATTSPKAAARWNGCAISTRSSRQQAARHGIERPDFETFWETGLHRRSGARSTSTTSPTSRRSARQEAQDAVRQDRDLLRDAWHRSATTTAPAIRSGSSPPNGSDRRKADRKLHLISNQPTMRLHGQLDNGPVSRAAKVKGREPLLDQSAGRRRARHRRRRCGARVQRARRLPRRRGGDRCDEPRRAPAADRRLVRSRRAGRASARSTGTAIRTC